MVGQAIYDIDASRVSDHNHLVRRAPQARTLKGMEDTQTSPSARSREEQLAVAETLAMRLLARALVPLGLVVVLTAIRVGLGTYGSRGTMILLWGGLAAAATLVIYALPTVLMARGRPRPWWTGIASVLGLLPLLYGIYLGAIGGALGAFRAESIMEAGLGVLFLLAGFAFLRDFSRLAVIGRGIEATVRGEKTGP